MKLYLLILYLIFPEWGSTASSVVPVVGTRLDSLELQLRALHTELKSQESKTTATVRGLLVKLTQNEKETTDLKTQLTTVKNEQKATNQELALLKAQLNITTTTLNDIQKDVNASRKEVDVFKNVNNATASRVASLESTVRAAEMNLTWIKTYLIALPNVTTIVEILGKAETSIIKTEIDVSVMKSRLDRLERKTNTHDERVIEKDDRNRKEILKYPAEMTSSETNVDFRLLSSLIHKLGDGKADEDRKTDGLGSGSGISGRSGTSNCVDDKKQAFNIAAQQRKAGEANSKQVGNAV